MTYTSLTLDDIFELSFPQYKRIVAGINRKINWDIELNALAVSADLNNELNPLYSDDETEDKVFRMSDALALQGVAGKQ